MKKFIYVMINMIFLTGILQAQTAERIEDLLKLPALSYGQAALFVMEAADVHEIHGSSVISNHAAAFRFAMEKNWLPKKAVAEEKARLDGIALILLESFEIKGGLLYRVFKNPHYAYRELVYKDIIQGRVAPDMAVSGDLLLFMVSRLLSGRPEGNGEDYDIDMYIRLTAEEYTVSQSGIPGEEAAHREQESRAVMEALAAEINIQLEAQEMEDTSARITEQGVTISLSNIQFLANSSELPPDERRKLQEIARILQTVSYRRILVTGHTALAGTAEERLRISNERAGAVAAYLVSLGVRRADEVFAHGFGSERPIADNSTPEGMALNRRVEITILEGR